MRGSGGMGSNRVGFVPTGKDAQQSEWRDHDELTGVRKSGYNSGYDRIIMNPPCDAEHVQHAYSLLKPGGRLVTIMGEGVFYGQDKKAVALCASPAYRNGRCLRSNKSPDQFTKTEDELGLIRKQEDWR